MKLYFLQRKINTKILNSMPVVILYFFLKPVLISKPIPKGLKILDENVNLL